MEAYPLSERLALIRELCDLHDLASASSFIDTVKRDHPDCLDVYIENFYLWFAMGDPAHVLGDLRAVHALAPDSAAEYFCRGVILESTNVGSALELLDVAIGFQPEFQRAWYVRGRIHMKLDHLPEAVRDLNQAAEMNPRHACAVMYAAEAKAKTGNWTGAIWYLSDYLRLPEIYEEEYACRLMAYCCDNLADELRERKDKRPAGWSTDELFS